MVVVQSAYLTRHLGGVVHMLVFAFIHGVRTSMVWRAQVTSDDAHPCPMKNRVLTTAVSPSSTYIPCGRGAGGGGGGSGIWVSVAWRLAVLVVSEVSVVASASVLGLQTAAGVVCWHVPGQALSFFPDLCAGYLPCDDHVGSSVVPPAASRCSAGAAAVRASGRPWTTVYGQHTLVHGGLWHSTRPPTGGAVYT